MPGLSDILPALHRRTSSIRERLRTVSLTSSASKQHQSSDTESYRPYSVYRQSSSIMPPSPAIAILDSPEATQKILEAVLESANGRRTLSRLARTCRAWLDPALNVLWRELDSLAPIIGLFPSHLLKKTRKPGLGLAAPPQEKDWEKILKYGGRILKITYDELANNVSTSIFPIFEEYRPTTYILPNLQHLTWKITSPDNLDRAALFLTSELQGFVLHLGGAGMRFPTLPAFLADLGSRMKLQSFSINSTVGLPDTFTDLLQPQNRLEKLAIVAPGAFWTCPTDPSSRSTAFLEKCAPASLPPDSVESHTDSGVFSGDEVDFSEIRKSLLKLTGDGKKTTTFPALTLLQLTGSASSIVAFLAHLSSPLAQLDITIEDPPDAADWRDLSATMCERFGSSLTSLRVGATLSSKFGDLVRSTSRAAPAPSRLSLEHLAPLPVLRNFSVDLPESICFTPLDIARLADMAPNLEEVRLCPLARFAPATPPQLTLENLAPLVRNCTRLNTLAVVIHAKPGVVEPSASSNSLSWLHVGHSWVADTLQVAILLSQLAPHLETIKWFTERNRPGFVEANARSWQKVSDILPHLQNLRLTERRAAVPQKETVVEYVQVAAPRPSMADKAIDATVLTADCEVDATPSMVECSVQARPSTNDREMQASPPCASVAIDATPQTIEVQVEAIPETAETQVDATPQTAETHVDAVALGDPESEGLRPRSQINCVGPPAVLSVSSVLSLIGFLCRVCITYPLSLPMRMLNASLGYFKNRTGGWTSNGGDVALDTLNDNPIEADNLSKSEQAHEPVEGKQAEEVVEVAREFVRPWMPSLKPRKVTGANNSATRHFPALHSSAWTYIMSDNKKQERDFTPEVDAILPEAASLAKSGKLQPALDKLLVLEKQTRNAADLNSTTRLAKAIVEHCYEARDFDALNANVSLLSKKHGQLKAAVQAIVELVMGWLEDVKKTAGIEKWLELVQTLRGIFLETPRARVTLMLSHYHESLADGPPKSATYKEQMQTACELLSDLQVETYSSMDRREKTEFILEQMRLLIVVARLKDAELDKNGKEVLGGGETEWVKDNEDLKLKYYDLMIQHALHGSAYLDVAKYYYKVWETPSIKEDESEQGKAALEHIVYYIVLAPHSNEQSDMLHHLFADPALVKLELHYNLVKCFTTRELMRWPGIETIYGEFLRKTSVFSSEKQWEDLHTRVIEHPQYYTRITLPRLTSLLDLNQKQTEETIARLVVAGTIWARIDRPAGIVNFRNQRSPEDVMNDWSSDMQKLLGVVEKTWMGMNAAQAAQSRVKV
ncbi:26S proteasome non-ATPase regulatory subunit 12 [Mycena venus]|uniref:26S proteasome non-ATPase regulatory subunit 12 n=1 Tax=Mycena venus TaxID=2733690 RepID=A0A8H7CTF6_9AGAR|nr:26S proteasome non-ATPase regulatory subunit 12 [Mycena venus]